jgi:formylglycine-generating enzyme required for sulfatase activity
MADIFISYKRERRPAARHLEQILIRYGYSVWFDLDLVRGQDYEAQIERELSVAKAVIVLWCGLSVRSPGVRSEANRAKSQGKLVPLVIERCELPLFSTLEQNIDLTTATGSPRDPAFDPMLDDLERLIGQAPQWDRKAMRDYEATWRTMGALPLVRFPLEPAPLREVILSEAITASAPTAGPAHDYAFWERQWDKQGAAANLVALRAIAEEAPRYFANQARARIVEIEADQRRQAEREQLAREAEAKQRAEQERAEWERFEAERNDAEAARIAASTSQARARIAKNPTERSRQAERKQRAQEAEARSKAEQERLERDRAAAEKGYRAEGRVYVDAKLVHGAPAGWFKPGAGKGEWFKDIDTGPEMVVMPAGEFVMGSNDFDNEKPPHRVTIRQPFAVARFAVTFDEWDACVEAGGCNGYRPDDHLWGRGNRPVVNVSWNDVKEYVSWLSAQTGQMYRLLSEAEWEYAARAGSVTPYPWGDFIGKGNANGRDSGSKWGGQRTAPVGSFPPNQWGLYDMHGNAWEWVEDPYHASYDGGPEDGSVWAGGGTLSRVLRGGSWNSRASYLCAAYRVHSLPIRSYYVGFRVARTLSPLSL